MGRSYFLACCLLLAFSVISRISAAQKREAYDLLPPDTQAVVWIPDVQQLQARWTATQLSELFSEPRIRVFFQEQRKELEQRFMEAGWRLNVKPSDLAEISSGQVALAWIERANVPRKPFALALIADVVPAKAAVQSVLDQVEQELVRGGAKKATLRVGGVPVTRFTMPQRTGELLIQNTFFTVVNDQLVVTDDQDTLQLLINRIQSDQQANDCLAREPVFIQGRKLTAISGKAQVEYFVRPLGFARILRSIAGKRTKSRQDMLAALENQGFGSIQCVCGEVEFGAEFLDVRHHGYIVADRPLSKSAAILDFPNKAERSVPGFVGANVSSLLVTYWNAEDAFWKAEGLVDEIAGTKDVFKEIIKGIKEDPKGARVDIETEVLPYLTNDIYSITESSEEVSVDARRNLIALKITDGNAFGEVVDRVMSNEPEADLVDYNGHPIWQVTHREDANVTELDLSDDFGDFGPAPAAPQQPAPGPWLNNFALTVHDEYFLFASHVEMIEQAIEQSESGTASPLTEEKDFLRVMNAIKHQFGNAPASAWQINRADKAYRVQYELFKQGKLRQSQSMLASILDRLLQTESEINEEIKPIDGSRLPPFSEIENYLQPSGLMVQSTDNGWEFGGFLLSPAAPTNPTTVSQRQNSGTARAGRLPFSQRR